MSKKMTVDDYILKAPLNAAAHSKYIKDKRYSNLDARGRANNLQLRQIESVVKRLLEKEEDVENILKLFPDTELGMSILVSSIISPKDMITNEIHYSNLNNKIPISVKSAFINVLKEEIENHYKIEEGLPDLLKDVLFYKGSHVDLIIPENILDDIINGKIKGTVPSLETVNQQIYGRKTVKKGENRYCSLGIMRQPSETTQTNSELLKLDISDNFWAIKLPEVNEVVDARRREAVISSAVESTQGGNVRYDNSLYDRMYKAPVNNYEHTVYVEDYEGSRPSVGRPYHKTLPSSAVIPIYNPSNPKDHKYYYIVLDQEGHPVTLNSLNIGNELVRVSRSYTKGNELSNLGSHLKSQLSAECDDPTIDDVQRLYNSMVEKHILESTSLIGKGFNAQLSNDLYDIMFARAMANQYTRLICVPKDFISYTALKYGKNGVGKSLFDNLKIMSVLRAVSLYTKIFTLMKNATVQTKVNLKLDPDDPNAKQTIEDTQHEVMKALNPDFRLDSVNPNDIINAIRSSGVTFSFEGHPNLPDTKLEYETTTSNLTLPDTELDEHLAKKTAQTMWLTPEIIEQGLRGDGQLATTVTYNNINLSKRLIQVQKPIMAERTRYVKMICKHDHIIRNKLKKILAENKETMKTILNDDFHRLIDNEDNGLYTRLLDDLIEDVILELPMPATTSFSKVKEDFEEYKEAVEDALDAYISDEMLTEGLIDKIDLPVEAIKSNWNNYLLRDWMIRNDYLTEISSLTTIDTVKNNRLGDIYQEHIFNIIRTTNEFNLFINELNKDTGTDIEGDETSDDPEAGGSDPTTPEDVPESEDVTDATEDKDEETKESSTQSPEDESSDAPLGSLNPSDFM